MAERTRRPSQRLCHWPFEGRPMGSWTGVHVPLEMGKGQGRPTECWSCDAEVDSARHTLQYCPAWTTERSALQNVVGQNLDWRAIVTALRREDGRRAFLELYCEAVITRKEAIERDRERAAGLPAQGAIRID
ncbi:PREDICTED: uncharacterized protein LOC108763664 [Trachymyrmex cornetzi]|uniref:uncharacterized protein LOC108763664 n=1 Tax=Trachymyrmex cornetzi TaxID=471704 RepID=UPI00084F5A92|nr:PREDICTED: uncharacterized protein LOC108763664 [Trachymyrmex cornetzi]